METESSLTVSLRAASESFLTRPVSKALNLFVNESFEFCETDELVRGMCKCSIPWLLAGLAPKFLSKELREESG